MAKRYKKEIYEFLKSSNLSSYTIDEILDLLINEHNVLMDKESLRKFLNLNKINYKRLTKWNHRLNGDEQKLSKGHIIVKINNKWMYKSRYIYEQYHNVKLKDDEYIIHKDGNISNFDIDNLILVDRRVACFRAVKKLASKNPNANELGINIARLNIKMKEVKENERKN